MIDPSDLLISKPSYSDVIYSYQEGLSKVLPIIAEIAIFALISMIISLFIGLRKNDCQVVFVTNILVKTVSMVIYQILDYFIYFDNWFYYILFFLAIVIAEGVIYKKVLKSKKHNVIKLSLICNGVTVEMLFVFAFIYFKFIV